MNRRELLKQALDSLRQQTRLCDVAIVIDAGDDGSDQLCAHYPFVTYVRQTTKGLTPARNEALALATCDYVGMLDSDDYYEPNFLEVCANLLDLGADVAYSQGYRITPSGRQRLLMNHKQPRELLRSLVSDNFVIASFALQRRDCFTRVNGYREGLALADDYDLYLRFALAGFQFRHAATPLSNRLHHEGSLTLSDPVANTRAILEIISYNQEALCTSLHCTRKQLLSGTELRLGQQYFDSGHLSQARTHLLRSLAGAPLNWRSWAYLMACLTSPYSLRVFATMKRIKQVLDDALCRLKLREKRW